MFIIPSGIYICNIFAAFVFYLDDGCWVFAVAFLVHITVLYGCMITGTGVSIASDNFSAQFFDSLFAGLDDNFSVSGT